MRSFRFETNFFGGNNHCHGSCAVCSICPKTDASKLHQCDSSSVYDRLQASMIAPNGTRRYPLRFGRANSSHTRGTGDQSGGSGGTLRAAQTYYSGIERGVRNVSLVNIEKVAKGLKTSLPHLFERL
jgi:hypothetical protein